MENKTIQVIPDSTNRRWVLKSSGVSLPGIFETQSEATAEAKKLTKGRRGQVVVLTKSGRIIGVESHGLPKIQRAMVRSKVGSKAIEKAVSTVVKGRRTPA